MIYHRNSFLGIDGSILDQLIPKVLWQSGLEEDKLLRQSKLHPVLTFNEIAADSS